MHKTVKIFYYIMSIICLFFSYCSLSLAATSMQIGNTPPLEINGDSFDSPFLKNKNGDTLIRLSPKVQQKTSTQQIPSAVYPQIYIEPKVNRPNIPSRLFPKSRPKKENLSKNTSPK